MHRTDFDDRCTSAVFEKQTGAGAIGVHRNLTIRNRRRGALIGGAATDVLMR
jgi:hypothetical protein